MSDSEFEELLADLADEPPVFTRLEALDLDALEPKQKQRLALFLRSQAKLRTALAGAEPFVARVMVAARGSEGFVRDVMREQSRRTAPIPFPKRTSWLPWSIAAAACLAALASWWKPTVIAPPVDVAMEPGLPADVYKKGAIGVLVNESHAQFAAGNPRNDGFAPGRYQITKGLAHVRLLNGTDLVLRAPMSFTLESPMKLHLDQGGLRVRVSEQAHGFTVSTEGVEYRDLGTEFTVNAGTQPGQSTMRVYDGAVDVYSSTGKKLDNVKVGDAVSFSAGTLKHGAELPSADVPEAEVVKFQDWQDESKRLRADPTLVAYYSFQRDDTAPNVLRDVKVEGKPADGAIHGPRWVTGRWPGKQALFYDHDDDYVETQIPGSYQTFTVAAWVLMDRFDFSNNAIFASNGWKPGAFHMNVNRWGSIFGGVYDASSGPSATGYLPRGVWSLVVMTADMKKNLVEGWVNGRHIFTREIPPPAELHPGVCRIGSCLVSPGENNPVRTIRGRVDELFVWNRILPAKEIGDLYDKGCQNLLELPPKPTPSPTK